MSIFSNEAWILAELAPLEAMFGSLGKRAAPYERVIARTGLSRDAIGRAVRLAEETCDRWPSVAQLVRLARESAPPADTRPRDDMPSSTGTDWLREYGRMPTDEDIAGPDGTRGYPNAISRWAGERMDEAFRARFGYAPSDRGNARWEGSPGSMEARR